MSTIQYVSLQSFNGGQNDRFSPDKIAFYESPTNGRNTRTDGEAFKLRPGYTTIADNLGAAGGITLMAPFLRSAETNDRLMCSYNNGLYKIDPYTENTWTNVAGVTLTAPATDSCYFKDYFFLFNGADKPYVYDGTTVTQPLIKPDSVTGNEVFTDINSYEVPITTPTKVVEWTAAATKSYVVRFSIFPSPGGATCHGRVYVNGAAVGTDRSGTSTVYFSETFAVTAGDKIQIYGWWIAGTNSTSGSKVGSVVIYDPSVSNNIYFTPSMGDIYAGSLVVAGVPNYPNVAFISKPSTSGTLTKIFDFSGAINTGGSDEVIFDTRVTAMRSLSTYFVIWTYTGAYYISGFSVVGSNIVPNINPVSGAGGCVSDRTVTAVENDLYYLTPKREIKSIQRGFAANVAISTTPMSKKIQRFINEQTDPDVSGAFSYYDQAQKLYKLYLRKKDQPNNWFRIVGDLTNLDNEGIPAWTIDDHFVMSSGCYYKNNTFIGSTVIGQAYKDEDGTADDDDAAIQSLHSTKDLTANNPMTIKNYRVVNIFGEITLSSVVYADVYVDDILVVTSEINGSDIVGGSTLGIGVDKIGEEEIGREGENAQETFGQLKEFTKRIEFKSSGKKMRVDFRTDGNNNEYRVRQVDYGFIPKSRLYAPVVEK